MPLSSTLTRHDNIIIYICRLSRHRLLMRRYSAADVAAASALPRYFHMLDYYWHWYVSYLMRYAEGDAYCCLRCGYITRQHIAA